MSSAPSTFVIMALALVLIASPIASGQLLLPHIDVFVTNSEGQPLSGSQLHLRRISDSRVWTFVSDRDGRVPISRGLSLDQYLLAASLSGFSSVERVVALSASAPVANVTLRLGVRPDMYPILVGCTLPPLDVPIDSGSLPVLRLLPVSRPYASVAPDPSGPARPFPFP